MFESREARERREVNVVVDALLGTGFEGQPDGRYGRADRDQRRIFRAQNRAVDLPSGLGGCGDACAPITRSRSRLRRSSMMRRRRRSARGKLIVADIGIPPG